MNYPKLNFYYLLLLSLSLLGCGGAAIISTPLENIDSVVIKETPLTDEEINFWSHLDLKNDTVPGMSINKAYSELIKNKKGEAVVVAIIDSGIDIDHKDLEEVIWVNKDEIANNGKDDDDNGYVDDINGWNFIGEANYEQLEYVRLLASKETSNPRYGEALATYENELYEYKSQERLTQGFINQVQTSNDAIEKHLNKTDYSREDLNTIKTGDLTLLGYASQLKSIYTMGYESPKVFITLLKEDLKVINEYLNYHLNLDFDGRSVVGDDPDNFEDRNYGNANVKPFDNSESHGTHVAGIVAAKRNNGMGMNGVANNVKIMSLRTIPSGDEYDKDVALAIRYAVDNGASIINMSFGKYFSPHPNWVEEAIIYAAKNNVLLVSGAGNEGYNLDTKLYYPSDENDGKGEISDNLILVGATASRYGSNMVASYSNYGKNAVDVFAPGSDIYSTYPNNEFAKINGTSMAAPAVAGIAAVLKSQYPKLTASEIKEIILNSGLPLTTKVLVNGEIKDFANLSKSARLANLYNAILIASKY